MPVSQPPSAGMGTGRGWVEDTGSKEEACVQGTRLAVLDSNSNPNPESNAVGPGSVPAAQPESARQRRHREALAEAEAQRRARARFEFESPPVAMWPRLQGARVYEGLFPPYRLPGGSDAYLYRGRKDRVDEVRPAGDGAADAADAPTAGPTAGREVDELARQLLRAVAKPPVAPVAPRVAAMALPRPATATLPPLEDLYCLRGCVVPADPPTPAAVGAPPPARIKGWRLEDSVFAAKPKENDSRSFLDRPCIDAEVSMWF